MTGGLRSLVDALVYGLAQVSSLKRESMNAHEVGAGTFGHNVINKPLEWSVQLYVFVISKHTEYREAEGTMLVNSTD